MKMNKGSIAVTAMAIMVIMASVFVGCKDDKHVDRITVKPSNLILTVEEEKPLEAVVSPYNADNTAVTWSAPNEEYVSVNGQGVAKAKKNTPLNETIEIVCTADDNGVVQKVPVIIGNFSSRILGTYVGITNIGNDPVGGQQIAIIPSITNASDSVIIKINQNMSGGRMLKLETAVEVTRAILEGNVSHQFCIEGRTIAQIKETSGDTPSARDYETTIKGYIDPNYTPWLIEIRFTMDEDIEDIYYRGNK